MLLLLALAVGSCSQAAHAQDAPAHGTLVLAGPAAVVSFPLMHMVESGALKGLTVEVRFRMWQSPDQLRVMLTRGEVDYSAAPSTLPAVLFNRGERVRMLNVSVWGLLWLLSHDEKVKSFADLREQKLISPFQRDYPAMLMGMLFRQSGIHIGENLEVRHTRDAPGAVALVLAGQGSNVLLGEPMVSMLLWRNAQQKGARPLFRVQSLEAAWEQAFPEAPRLPQAGIMVGARRSADNALNEAVVQAYARSACWCKAEAAACAAIVHKYLPHIPVEALEESVRATRLEAVPANVARSDLEALYRGIVEKYPQAIGGRLPEEAFYGP